VGLSKAPRLASAELRGSAFTAALPAAPASRAIRPADPTLPARRECRLEVLPHDAQGERGHHRLQWPAVLRRRSRASSRRASTTSSTLSSTTGSIDRTPSCYGRCGRGCTREDPLHPGGSVLSRGQSGIEHGAGRSSPDRISTTAVTPTGCDSRWFRSRRPSEVGVVGGHYVLVDENRGERYVRMTPTEHGRVIPAMAKGIPLANTFATFRRRVWVEAGGYPSSSTSGSPLLAQVAKLGAHHQPARGRG